MIGGKTDIGMHFYGNNFSCKIPMYCCVFKNFWYGVLTFIANFAFIRYLCSNFDNFIFFMILEVHLVHHLQVQDLPDQQV